MAAEPTRLRARAVRVGMRTGHLSDVYAFLLNATWRRLLAVFAAVYVSVNALFAALYVAGGDCISGARPGSFADAFNFSVETMTTVGYGHLSPHGTWGYAVADTESFVGVVLVAMATGLVFAKFSRPTSRVMFSKVAVIGLHNGRRCLMFRLANARGNEIVEATIRVSALKFTVTAEGDRMRRFYDMQLERASSPVFILTWLVIHPIDADSPLSGMSREQLVDNDVHIAVTMTGIDGTFAQTVYARHDYPIADIRFDARFADVIETLPDGRTKIDYARFHDTTPLDEPRATR